MRLANDDETGLSMPIRVFLGQVCGDPVSCLSLIAPNYSRSIHLRAALLGLAVAPLACA